MDFYSHVKRLVKERENLSLQDFIISIGLNHDSYYSSKRAGNLPRADEAYKIAQALGTTVEHLITGTPPERSAADEILDKFQSVIDQYRKPPKRK
jgi:transcriptional regulator with XRE-family HTH domain